MRSWLLVLVTILVLVAACGGSGSDGFSTNFADVEAVVAVMDRHTVSEPAEPLYALIGAYDGMKYEVEPGPFRIEIYVYKDEGRMSQAAKNAEAQAVQFKSTADTIVRTEGNVMLLMYHVFEGRSPSDANMDLLVADLRD